MNKTFVFRLYPTKHQAEILEETLEFCRQLYNAALVERRSAWKQGRISIGFYEQSSQLPAIKKCLPEYNDVFSQVLQDVLHRVERAFEAFFRRMQAGQTPGYPRFKGKDRYDSFTFPQLGFSIEDNRLKLSKIGSIKIKRHRPMEGQAKTLTIRRKNGKWYACFSVECDAKPLPKTGKEVGIDVGIESFATLSDRTQIENPRFFKQAERKIAILSRIVAKRAKGSKRRKKAAQALARFHEKVRNRRKDFHHKTAHELIEDFDTIKIEDLNVQGMVQNRHLAKSISDVAWAQFIAILFFKAEEAGRIVVVVNPRNTTQLCSQCGKSVPKKLHVRIHKCPHCRFVAHRDHNAALNILRRPGRGPQRGLGMGPTR